MPMRQLAIAILTGACLTLVHAQDFAVKADQYVSAYVQQNKFIGSVLVARDGKPIFRKGYGLANREWDIPNAPNTKFRLGSITKPFTATSIIQLLEPAHLHPDHPIPQPY